MSRIFACLTIALIACQPAATAQEKTAERQVAEAVMALPEPLQSGAAVKGYQNGQLVDLRQGSNIMICLADQPGNERWQVACYHRDLEPFMARGRELRAEGTGRDEVQSTRFSEIESGELPMPQRPMALYVLTGTEESYDPTTGQVSGAGKRLVIYVPYATEETLGISAVGSRERPWLMLPGTPSAHIMMPTEQQ